MHHDECLAQVEHGQARDITVVASLPAKNIHISISCSNFIKSPSDIHRLCPCNPKGRQAGSSPHTTLPLIRPALTFIGLSSLACSKTNIQNISIYLLVPLPHDDGAHTIKTSPRWFTITNSFLHAQCGCRT